MFGYQTEITKNVYVVTTESRDTLREYETRLEVNIKQPDPHSWMSKPHMKAKTQKQAKANHVHLVELTQRMGNTFEDAITRYNDTVKSATQKLTDLLNP